MKTEFMGTFAVVYFGGWAYMQGFFEEKQVDILGVALVHLFTYGLFTWVAYIFSGALFNPAITIVLMCFRKITLPKGIFYLIAQMTGSVVAAALIWVIAPEEKVLAFGQKGYLGFPNTNLPFLTVMIYEALGTCFIICAYYTSIVSKRAPKLSYGITMGMAYATMIMLFGAQTGAACNPARIFGPAMIEKKYFNLFEYYCGHLLGSLLGAFISEVVLLPTGEKGDMLKDKGANLNIKTDLKDELKGEFIEEIDSDDDAFDGRIEDVKAIDEKNRLELEERDRENKRKYYYDDSSDEETDHRKIKKKDGEKAAYEEAGFVPKIYEDKERVRDPKSQAEIVVKKSNEGNNKTLLIEKKYKETEIEVDETEEQKRQAERKKKLDEEKKRIAKEDEEKKKKKREEEEKAKLEEASKLASQDVPPPFEEMDELPPLEEPENM